MLPRDAMRCTFRELALYAEGVNEAKREEYRQAVSVAHLQATLDRVPRNKRLPPLSSLLPQKPTPPTAPDERRKRIRAMIQMLARPGEVHVGKHKKGKSK